ncbi:efflux RND transporter periplasmic adaptor subunit [Chloroflexota bacterium]
MSRWRIIGILLLVLVLVGITACDAFGGSSEEATGTQLVIVERGDLAVSVTGSGNVEASQEARLTFGTAGKIDKINVKEGDTVAKDDVLAKLDTSTIELALTQAQVAMIQAQLAVTQAQLAEQTAGYNLKNTKDTEGVLKLALFNAQISLDQAKYNLEKTIDLYTWTDIKVAQADVDESEDYLEYCLEKLYEYLPIIEDEEGREIYPTIEDDFVKPPGYKVWQDRLIHAQARLNSAKDRLEAMQSGHDTEETSIKKKLLEAAEMTKTQAEKDLIDLNEDIAIQDLQLDAAKQATEQTKQSVELAKQSLAEARKQLDEATITAPFGGVVACADAGEGDTILTTTTIIHLIDPTSLELIVEIDEIDIPGVEVGQEAIIEIDALPDTLFQGTVAAVYPMPNSVGGVVLYDAKLNLPAGESSGIKIGMSADADIIINERTNILLVPDRAIKRDSQGHQVVKVVVDEQTEERPVVIGISDSFDTEIV